MRRARCGAIVTVEEHQKHAGMGSRVAEILAQQSPTPIEFVGVDDTFGQSGDPAELIEYYGMGVDAIEAAAAAPTQRKKPCLNRERPSGAGRGRRSAAVALDVFGVQVVEQPAALTDLQQQAATAVMIFLVDLEMLGEHD